MPHHQLEHYELSGLPPPQETPRDVSEPPVTGGRPRGQQACCCAMDQYVASTKKHVLQKRRDWVGCLLELLLPILFIVGTVFLWIAFGDSTEAKNQFISYTDPGPLSQPAIMAAMRANLCYDDAIEVIEGLAACSTVSYTYACFGSDGTVPVASLCYNNDGTQFNPWVTIGTVLSQTSSSLVLPWPLDDLILIQWIARFTVGERIQPSAYGTPLAAIGSSGKLHFAPDNTVTRSFVAHLNSTSALFHHVLGTVFATMGDAETHVMSPSTEGSNWGIVYVGSMTPTDFNVQIRLNHTALPDMSDLVDPFFLGGTTSANGLYVLNGFNTLQNALSKYFLEQVANTSSPAAPIPAPYVAPMGYAAYDTQEFLAFGGQLAPLIIVLGFLYPVSQLSKRLVLEKERRIREAMLIMGLSNGAFYFSWIVVYVVQHLGTSVLITIILKNTYVPNANNGALFFCFFFFQLSTVTLSGLISSFFSKSRLASLITPLLYFVLSIPQFAIDDSSPSLRTFLLILSPTAFANGIQLIFNAELGGGLGNNNINDNEPSMLLVLFMLAIDTVIYMVLWLYVDAVMPSEWGTPRGYCFCFTEPLRWCMGKLSNPGGGVELPDGRAAEGVYEASPITEHTSVHIAGLRKEFQRGGKTFTAVNNLYWTMEEGQISVLLGHNGAGKSTVMNMLTGMLEADGGDCFIYGHSVRHELHRVRQEIGYCPQHNVLWPELTCEEHLEFFAAIKGIDGEARNEAVTRMLKAVDLMDKRTYLSKDLSGGQKRKLCVAIAFVGGSRLIFLDEPTAGMDVGARRHTWELLQKMSAHHTILLTTHFMDEADLLGHKIAILSHGALQCSGSSLFLKSRLGVGYNIVLSVNANVNEGTLRHHIQHLVARAEQLSAGPGEVVFRIPSACIGQMVPLLAELETNGASWGVSNFSVSATTLEEIFLQIAHGDDAPVARGKTPLVKPVAAPSFEERQVVDNTSSTNQMPNGSQPPSSSTSNRPSDTHAPSHVQIPPPAVDCVWQIRRIEEGSWDMFSSQMQCMLTKRFRNSLRDRRTQCLQIVCPVVCILLAMLLTLIDFFNAPAIVLSSDVYEASNQEVNLFNCSNLFDTSIRFAPNTLTTIPTGFANAMEFSVYLMNTAKGRDEELKRYGAIACEDAAMQAALAATHPVSIAFYNSSTPHEISIGVFNYFNAIYRKASGANLFMTLINNPMPKTDRESAFYDSIKSIMIGIIIMIPFTFIPSTFVSWVVKERECKARHLQNVSGLKFSVYWMSNFIFDMASFLVTVALALVVFAIFDRTEYVAAKTIGPTIVLLVSYGLSGVAFAYLTSFFFKEHATAQNIVMLANFVTGFLLVLVVFILKRVESTEDVAEILSFIFRLIPSYCLGDGIINLALHQLEQSFTTGASAWDLDVVGWDIIYMMVEFPIAFAATLVIDHPGRRMKTQMMMHNADGPVEEIPNEDVDVARERYEVDHLMEAHRESDLVVVRNLRKEFSNGKVAVRNLSFGVHPGEVFGFLGTNGAGKTTTISIICQEFFPTSGHASVAGKDIVSDSTDALRCIGYCPQFDALLDLLTVEEHLHLYAGVRGIVLEDRRLVVENLASLCELTAYLPTVASELSGGNKRKLSVALSLIGGPSVVFLDEPSAGMDPVARRGLWKAISSVSNNCAVVLTTHHLEEVEALANRVAIMVDGALHCIGTKLHLKTKYGTGFEMHIKLRDSAPHDVFQNFVSTHIPAATLSERHASRFTFALPQNILLSSTFGLLEANKVALGITDYSVSQTSIEQVFLRISAEAEMSGGNNGDADASLTPQA